jgi:hypothetical protein
VVTDVYGRKVVGWAFGETMTLELVISALNMALLTRKPESVIHRSDQGSQDTGITFGNRLKEMGVRPSMGTVGDAYDNAMAKSFFARLECELIARRILRTKTNAPLAIFTWIETRYNPCRRHSGLGQMSPINFEMKKREKTPKTQQLHKPQSPQIQSHKRIEIKKLNVSVEMGQVHNALDEATVVLRVLLVLKKFLNIWAERITATEDLLNGIFVQFRTKLVVCKNLGFDAKFADVLDRVNAIQNRYSRRRRYTLEESGLLAPLRCS